MVTLSDNGTRLNDIKIIARSIMRKGAVQIITEEEGEDNNKKANIQNIYTIGKNILNISKEVQFENTSEWIKRSEFSYQRKK